MIFSRKFPTSACHRDTSKPSQKDINRFQLTTQETRKQNGVYTQLINKARSGAANALPSPPVPLPPRAPSSHRRRPLQQPPNNILSWQTISPESLYGSLGKILLAITLLVEEIASGVGKGYHISKALLPPVLAVRRTASVTHACMLRPPTVLV